MIIANNISIFSDGVNSLIEKSDFIIKPKKKVALVGNNGTGKTTLLNTMLSKNQLEIGKIDIPKEWRIASIEQEIDNINLTAIEYLIQGDKDYVLYEQQYRDALEQNNASLISSSIEKLDIIDAWTIKSRAAIILKGLRFTNSMLDVKVKELSGGWRVRLNLARALIVPSDLLVLDEPTNHLDLDAIFWLEDYLIKYKGTVLLVSHDQDFMDAVVNQIIHIDNKKLITYYSNYSDFLVTRAKYIAENNKLYIHQEQKIAQLQRFVDRFKAIETKSSQARSKMKAIERLKVLTPIMESIKFNFTFFPVVKRPSFLINMRNAKIGYDNDTIVFHKADFFVNLETKVSLLGINGAGKSTLIKALANELEIMDGEIERSQNLNIGYLNQHSIDSLTLNETAIWHLMQIDQSLTEFNARKFLGRFNFQQEKSFQKVSTFSGGEKSRLMLALIIYQKPNILLLDEPTNNLDLDMRKALCDALLSYDGAVILVSHDRSLLRTISDNYYLIDEGNCNLFDGDLNDYYDWLKIKFKVK